MLFHCRLCLGLTDTLSGMKPTPWQQAWRGRASAELSFLWPLGGGGGASGDGHHRRPATPWARGWTESSASSALWAPPAGQGGPGRPAPLSKSHARALCSPRSGSAAEPCDSSRSGHINKLQRKSSQTFPCFFCSPNSNSENRANFFFFFFGCLLKIALNWQRRKPPVLFRFLFFVFVFF